jgi:SAM-dependent methyltransferase
MGCTLAHVANPLRVLAEINRVLKPDGILSVSSPNPNYYWENVLNIFYHHFKDRVTKAKHDEHFFEFSRYTMRTSAARSGFQVIREIGCSFVLVKLGWNFNPEKYPGLSYEIIYVMKKVGQPKNYATFEDKQGIHEIPTILNK